VAGHFPSLSDLDIAECSQLEKVFAFEHEAGDDGQEGTDKDGEQVLLRNLTYITFTSLPNFKETHHGFKLTNHVEQTITDCPKYAPSLYLYPGKTLTSFLQAQFLCLGSQCKVKYYFIMKFYVKLCSMRKSSHKALRIEIVALILYSCFFHSATYVIAFILEEVLSRYNWWWTCS